MFSASCWVVFIQLLLFLCCTSLCSDLCCIVVADCSVMLVAADTTVKEEIPTRVDSTTGWRLSGDDEVTHKDRAKQTET